MSSQISGVLQLGHVLTIVDPFLHIKVQFQV